ncbi:hypothetical protein M0R01_01565 [bacterium]|nr:hypothetical protein [bacterium]
MKNIIKKIRDLELKGRGGGDFETWKKWDMVTATRGDKYIICNGADGEILVSKDGYILENYLDYVIEGINIAIDTVKAKKAYFYLREDYYEKHLNKILSLGNDKIEVFKKPDVGYIGGEETVICEIIEGRSAFPRRKPPYLTEGVIRMSYTY